MNIEQKAKAYDEALNWMRELYPGLHGATKEDAEHYFPELRESDDERTRKEIIDYLGLVGKGDGDYAQPMIDRWISYLEKQKERVANSSEKSTEEDERIRKGLIEVVSDIAGSWPFEEHKITKKEALAYLEKQKEYKPTSFNEPYNPDDYEVVMEGNATSLKQKEQKPAENGMRAKIISKASNEKQVVLLSESDGNAEIGWNTRSLEDTKKLLEYGIAFINKQLGTKPAEWSEDYNEDNLQTRFAFYTYKDDPSTLYLSNVFVEEASRNHGFGTHILKAAEKVAETVGAITIRLKVKQDSPANNWYRKHGYAYMTLEDGYDWLEKSLEYIKTKKSIKWGGDDELMIESLIAYLKGTKQDFISNDMVYWLESLPERFNLQPKQEWSEEDELMRTAVIQTLKMFGGRGTTEMQIDWLKSLRPQPKKEWSKKDKKILQSLHHVMNCADAQNAVKRDGLNIADVCDFLFSVEPNWKPSEEQMKHLERCFSHGHTSQLPNQHILESLYNELKKLT